MSETSIFPTDVLDAYQVVHAVIQTDPVCLDSPRRGPKARRHGRGWFFIRCPSLETGFGKAGSSGFHPPVQVRADDGVVLHSVSPRILVS